MNFSFGNSESLFEEPNFLNALFKYSLLQQENPCIKDLNSFYQPEPSAVIKIVSERGSTIVNKNEIVARLPKRKLCVLDPHEKLKHMLLEDNLNNGEDVEYQSGSSDSTTISTPSVKNSLEDQQQLMMKIDQLNDEFVKGKVFKSDQDEDIKELQRLCSNNQNLNIMPSLNLTNAHSNINGNSCGNLSSSPSSQDQNMNNGQMDQNYNLSNVEGLKLIQKRIRRPRVDQMVKKVKEDTKNLLRNYGNAQSRFVLNNVYGKRKMDKFFDNNQNKIEDFKKWVAQLKLENFEQFKNVWHVQKGESNQEYKQLFREICFDFYENHASVYVLGSQMRSEDTRKTHIKYICRFLEGIVDPSSFYYFKKN